MSRSQISKFPNFQIPDAPLQAAHRIHRHALQRLADPEERAHGGRRDRSRGAGRHAARGVRALRSGTHRRRRARAGTGRASRALHRPAAAYPAQRGSTTRCPSDIYIRRIDKAPHRFHARHDAESRSYLYQISRRKTAFFKPFVWWIREPLDVARMREAAQPFVGMQNFASFTADEPGDKSTRVLVDRLELVEDGDLILVRIVGSHFLWRMVRRIVGVLAAVGRGELTPAQAAGFLDEDSDLPATLTAPRPDSFSKVSTTAAMTGPGPLRAAASVLSDPRPSHCKLRSAASRLAARATAYFGSSARIGPAVSRAARAGRRTSAAPADAGRRRRPG